MAYKIYAGQEQWVFEQEAIALVIKALERLSPDEKVKVKVLTDSPHGVTEFETEWISKEDIEAERQVTPGLCIVNGQAAMKHFPVEDY